MTVLVSLPLVAKQEIKQAGCMNYCVGSINNY